MLGLSLSPDNFICQNVLLNKTKILLNFAIAGAVSVIKCLEGKGKSQSAYVSRSAACLL